MRFIREQTTTGQFVFQWFGRGLDKRCDWVVSRAEFGNVNETRNRSLKRHAALRVILGNPQQGE